VPTINSNFKDLPKKTLVSSKLIEIAKKTVFYLILGLIILTFIFNQLVGVVLAGFFFITYIIYNIITLSSKRRILRLMQEYLIISDKEVAEALKRPIEDIRKTLSSLFKNQKNKKWLLAFLNKRYIFLNEKGVEKFKMFYNMGYNEKKILENLQKDMKIRSRAEVNAIISTLINNERLNN
jgi:hypothetical protein